MQLSIFPKASILTDYIFDRVLNEHLHIVANNDRAPNIFKKFYVEYVRNQNTKKNKS